MEGKRRVAFATSSAFVGYAADEIKQFSGNHDFVFESVVWDDPQVQWEKYSLVVVRSTWDYHLKPKEFGHWVLSLQNKKISLQNPASVILWNMDKHYLEELRLKGISIPNNIWIAKGEQPNLHDILLQNGWSKAVLKPTISASAEKTILIYSNLISKEIQKQVEEMVSQQDFMLQPFISEISTNGEWSLMFILGHFSHAVLKKPQNGDFRVQSEFGGSVEEVVPSSKVLMEAERVMSCIGEECLFARVDMVECNDGRILLMELELIEPELFLRCSDSASKALYSAIEKMCPSSSHGR